MEETPDMKEYIEERMRALYVSGASEKELDSFMTGVLETLYSLGEEAPTLWVINYMAGRTDRLYMTDEEFGLTQEE
tara:strand:- start:144 stop:371 length:228 start_codon:yes stop_codon:yes gene_type:complete